MIKDIKIKKNSITLEKQKDFKISWSKLRQFGECPASWFCINHADIINVEYVQINQTNALGGTIIQKLFETFINDRVYLRNDMNTYDDLLNWFSVNARALFKLIAKPLEDQLLIKYKNPRNYFKRNSGKNDLIIVQDSYHLDKKIKPPQIAFVDFEMLYRDYGDLALNGEEKFVTYLSDLIQPILELFVENKIVLNYMFSEAYIQTKVNGIVLNGFIDFVYNKNQGQGIMWDLKQLCEGFIVLDGKIKISKYVHKEQLFYYATLLYLKYKKRPSYVGFIDWSAPRFSMYEFDSTYLDILKSKIVEIQNTYVKLADFLSKYKGDEVCLADVELEYKPSSNCVFCPLIKVCELAIARQEELDKFTLAIENKKQTEAHLKEIGVDKNKPMQDIKL